MPKRENEAPRDVHDDASHCSSAPPAGSTAPDHAFHTQCTASDRDNQPPSKKQRRQDDASDNPGEQQQPTQPQLPQIVWERQRRQYDASDNPGEQQQPTPPQLPQIVGRDERGWVMIDGPPQGPNRWRLYKVNVGGKPLTLCAQIGHVMRVYVNPDPDIRALDEWQTPAGQGERIRVGNPVD